MNNLTGDTSVQGIINTGDTHEVKIASNKTGTAIRIKGDTPVSMFYLWIWKLAFCPEPIIDIQVAPTDSFSWQNEYEFTAP